MPTAIFLIAVGIYVVIGVTYCIVKVADILRRVRRLEG